MKIISLAPEVLLAMAIKIKKGDTVIVLSGKIKEKMGRY